MSDNTAIAKVEVSTMLNQDAGTMYCSIKSKSREDAGRIYNAFNNPDARVNDLINQQIMLKDVLIEILDICNEETGVIERAPRVVLIDADGKSYQSVSVGMYSAIGKLIQCFGEPTWDEPIPVTVKQVPTKRGSMLTLAI